MNTPRYDIYAFIHKGLRAFMAHTLVRTGRLDVHDEPELAEVSEELRELMIAAIRTCPWRADDASCEGDHSRC